MRPWRRLLVLFLAGGASAAAAETLRVGYFPNITHAQGVIGSETTREGRGWFERRLGPGVRVEWYAFNAGPSAMEAIFANSIDLTYTGPNPAINAFIRSEGEEIRVLAGAADGGAALVVQPGVPLRRASDFRGRRIATPQLGNTQDVAARIWLKKAGLTVTLTGGDALVVPTANADQLSLFRERNVDAVWTVEPWVSRLVREAGGLVLVEQPDAVTTILVSSSRLLRERPALAEKFRAAHAELTRWINAHPDEAEELLRKGLAAETRRPMPADLVRDAWKRITFTDRVEPEKFAALVADAQAVGFLRHAIPLGPLFSGKP